ncbi:hypothetical protein X975_22767, partial [Stegodyphus mimosarum]
MSVHNSPTLGTMPIIVRHNHIHSKLRSQNSPNHFFLL